LYWTKEMERSIDSTSNLSTPGVERIAERVFLHMKSNEAHNTDFYFIIFLNLGIEIPKRKLSFLIHIISFPHQ
jgi:hypothetical protein